MYEYNKMFNEAGLVIENQYLIDFWLHRIIFERKLAKKMYSYIEGNSLEEKRIKANSNTLFRLLSAIFTFFSRPCLFKNKSGWGYSYFVIKKK